MSDQQELQHQNENENTGNESKPVQQEEKKESTPTKKKTLGGDEYAKSVAASNMTAQFTVIAVGQAGSNIATELQRVLNIPSTDVIALNMSQADLSVSVALPENRIKFGRTEGAGKNRDLSKEEMKANMSILETLANKYKEKLFRPNNIVIVAYSTGGGTGSGTGTIVTTYLTQYVLSKKEEYGIVNTPQVLGLAILPILDNNRADAGEKSYQNTLECLSELYKIVTKKLGTFCLISNDLTDFTSNDPIEVYREVNKRVAEGFKRFFVQIGKSDSNADLQDRLTALEHPGIFGIYSTDSEINYSFLVPQQVDSAKMLIAELPESEEHIRAFRHQLASYNINSNEEIIAHANCESGVFALFGIDAVNKLVEPIKNKLEDLIIRSASRAKSITDTAIGFDSMETSAKHIANNSNKRSEELDNIGNLF